MSHYGHGSWIALAIFGFVLLVRVLTSQRHRQGHGPGRRESMSQFTASRPEPRDGPVPVGQSGPASATGVASGWFTDPTGRHGQRYWSGTAWTDHVLDDGVPGTDPPPPVPPRQPQG